MAMRTDLVATQSEIQLNNFYVVRKEAAAGDFSDSFFEEIIHALGPPAKQKLLAPEKQGVAQTLHKNGNGCQAGCRRLTPHTTSRLRKKPGNSS